MNKLQNRLILTFVLLLLIPTAIITLYGSTAITNQLIDTARSSALQNNRRTAASIEEFLSRAKSDVLFLSRISSARTYLDTLAAGDTQAARAALSVIQTTFLTYGQNVLLYDEISFLDRSGQELVRIQVVDGKAVLTARSELKNQSNAAFFKNTLQLPQGRILISPLSLNTANGQVATPYQPVIRFSAPVLTTLGDVGGIVTVNMLADPILSLVKPNNIGDRAYLIDADGTYLAGTDNTRLFARDLQTNASFIKDYPRDSKYIMNELEGTQFDAQDQPDVLQVYTRVGLFSEEGVQWTLYYTVLKSDILSSVTNSRLVITVVAAVALLVAVLAALVITRSITQPVETLTKSAIAISEGDLKQRVAIRDRSEIGTLANAFNTMTEQLSISYATLEKRVEERTAQLAEATRRAETASKAKSVFLSNMSHELRTPLNVVIGYTSSMLNMPQMYDNAPLPRVYQQDIQLIMENGRYLLGLINDILDLSKIEAGKLELNRTAVDLNETFQGVIATSVGLVKDKPVQIRPDFPDHLPKVWADPMRVRQIILNLMSNASKFTERGSITLQARDEDGKVRISVIDTGIGIPEAALKHIFDRFQQAEQGIEKQYGGTGLGLDISRQLTIMHGGELVVKSVVGQGSIFSFTLPVATVQETGLAPVSDEPQKVVKIFAPEDVKFEQRTVLLAEDDAPTRDMMQRALEQAGHLVVAMEDGAQALEAAVSLLPDVIILDVKLPNTDGLEILEKLRANPETAATPIMLCTARDDLEKLSAQNHVLYLHKPITPEQLLASMQELLSQLMVAKGS
ncbi:MAG: response regulator [Anaerolineae bacterium]|nr:response regulator [Anaerolineae bacterium]